jgi:hypothetical protein
VLETGILPPNTLFLMLLAVGTQLVCGVPTLLCANETPYTQAHCHKAGEHAQHIHSHVHPNPYREMADDGEDKVLAGISRPLKERWLRIRVGYSLTSMPDWNRFSHVD